jgi:hypothetical protein
MDPYPGSSDGALARFFPPDHGLPDVSTRSAPHDTHTATSVWNFISGLQSFTHVQARRFARHPDCSYRSALAPGSRGFYVPAYLGSLPPRAGNMLIVRFGQLTIRGLSPLKIRSLVGCTANEKIPTRTRTSRVGRFLPDDLGIVIVHLVHDNRNYRTIGKVSRTEQWLSAIVLRLARALLGSVAHARITIASRNLASELCPKTMTVIGNTIDRWAPLEQFSSPLTEI